VGSAEDEALIRESLSDYEIIGFLPEMDEISMADRKGVRPYEDISKAPEALMDIARKFMALV